MDLLCLVSRLGWYVEVEKTIWSHGQCRCHSRECVRRVRERTSPADYVRTPLKGHVPYAESAGTAKVQPNLRTLEALMRQLQSTMAHLKKDDQSSDSHQIKAYHASVDTQVMSMVTFSVCPTAGVINHKEQTMKE